MKIDFYHVDAFEAANYEPIWRHLRAKGVNANLVGVPDHRNTAAAGWFDFERFKSYCAVRELSFSTEADPSADVAVTTQNIDILSPYQHKRARLMYGPTMYPLAWGLQSHAAQPFDLILTHSQLYTNYYANWLPKERLPVVGYPRYDDFFAGKLNRHVIRAKWNIFDAKPVIVFLPTWGDNTAFEQFFPALLQLAHEYHVIIRPHHCTLRFEPKRFAQIQASGLLMIDDAFDLSDVFAAADVVISDVRSGALLEACMCDVPTVGLVMQATEITGWLAQYQIGNMLSLCAQPAQLNVAIQEAYLSTTQATARRQWALHYVAHRDGSAGERAANALIKFAEANKPVTSVPSKKKIIFLLGSAQMSGGTYVILQHATYLASLGYDITLALVFMPMQEFKELQASQTCWHPAIKTLKFIPIDECKEEHYHMAIFTWWATIYSYDKIHADTYTYFVQSIESRFYQDNFTFMKDIVNRTYQLGLPIITEATWIQSYLTHHYKAQVNLVRNGVLKSVYTEEGAVIAKKSPHQLRVLVEGSLTLNFKNVPRTIAVCREANVGEVWLLTSTVIDACPPGVDRVFSNVPLTDVPAIYRSCDVLVKLSYVEGMFGPPLEMFHCGGTAIVYDVTGFDEYIQHEVNALVAKTDDEQAVVRYLKALHADRNLLARLIAGAKETAANWMNWEVSSAQFTQALESIAAQAHTQARKEALAQTIEERLFERLEVVFVRNGQTESQTLLAKPSRGGDRYALTVPLSPGATLFAVLFGKNYRQVSILNVQTNNQSGMTGQVSLNMHRMVQQENQLFTCEAHDSSLIFQANIQGVPATAEASSQLTINYQPISVSEPA